MTLEISGNKENLSLSWETFLLFNILNDEVKTRQESLILHSAFCLRSPTHHYSSNQQNVVSRIRGNDFIDTELHKVHYVLIQNSLHLLHTVNVCVLSFVYPLLQASEINFLH